MSELHPIREEDLEFLALGVLGGEECKSFRAHLASCEECSLHFAEARGRMALFALAAPSQVPAESVRERLFQKIRADVPARSISTSTTPVRWWNTIWVPAAAVLAIATVFLWNNDRRLENQLRQIQQAEENSQAQAQREQAVVSVLAAADTKTVSLTPNEKASKSWADVKYNSRMGMICYNGDLPAPPPHKEYQMWIVPMVGSPISAGTFMPTSTVFSKGHMCMARMPEGINCKSFAVTIEPMGGMPYPTGPQVLTGSGL